MLKRFKQVFTALLILALLMAISFPASAADANAIKAYTLPKEVLVKRVSDTVQRGQITYTNFYNICEVTRKDLQEAAATAIKSGGKVFFNFDTLTNEEVTARITVNPLLVKSEEGSISFIVDTSAETNKNVKEKFEKLLGKPVAVMCCGQMEDFGMTVVISAKLDISALNKEKLIAYSYDPASNKYTEIEKAKCIVDKQGFIYLQSKKGGYIVITDAD